MKAMNYLPLSIGEAALLLCICGIPATNYTKEDDEYYTRKERVFPTIEESMFYIRSGVVPESLNRKIHIKLEKINKLKIEILA